MGVVEDHLGGIENFFCTLSSQMWFGCSQMWFGCSQLVTQSSQLWFDCSQMLVFVPSPGQKKKGDLANGRISQKLGVLPHFLTDSSQKKMNNPRYITTTWEDHTIFHILLPSWAQISQICDRLLPIYDILLPNGFWLLPSMYALLPNVCGLLPSVV